MEETDHKHWNKSLIHYCIYEGKSLLTRNRNRGILLKQISDPVIV